ncbi:hypothetical protein GCM10009038_15460 [Salinicola rhizosphaerae]|uniref:NADP-dependent oxidoreductase domain-containing protein n=1 Tax=Salinicola rhizosphaerae TaxID=1443141 RepID=A0ABQ3DVC8_9GAMM|nr:hypothetical protein GCM10009038_15460 [Salinicola rhizosphaerae]
MAEARGISVARIALAWLLAKPHVTSVVIGAKRLDQLDDNMGAVDIQLTEDELSRLEAVSALAPEYPGWMVAQQDASRCPSPATPEALP